MRHDASDEQKDGGFEEGEMKSSRQRDKDKSEKAA